MSTDDEEETNVYQFPDLLTEERKFNANSARNFLEMTKKEFVEEAADSIYEETIHDLKQFGFYNGIGKYDGRDLHLIKEMLTSIMYRHYGFEHFLHNIVEQLMPYELEDSEKTEPEPEPALQD